MAARALAVVEKPAADYDSHEVAAEDAQAAALRAVFEGSLAPQVKERVRHDPRLDVVARVELEQYLAISKPLGRKLQWVTWRAGFPGRIINTRVWYSGSRKSHKSLDGDLQLEARAAEIPAARNPGPLSYGLVRAESGSGRFGQAVVIGSRTIALKGVPRHVAPGAAFVVAGQVLVPADKVGVSYETIEGVDTHVEGAVGTDGTFSLDLSAPALPGRYLFELTAGDRTLATVPIFVGLAEPGEPDAPLDAVAQTQVLRSRLAALRAEDGKPPGDDPVLDAVAEKFAASVCQDDSRSNDHKAVKAALTQAGYGDSRVKTYVRKGSLFRLKKDPTGLDGLRKATITTCQITSGDKDGRQYVLLISAEPK